MYKPIHFSLSKEVLVIISPAKQVQRWGVARSRRLRFVSLRGLSNPSAAFRFSTTKTIDFLLINVSIPGLLVFFMRVGNPEI